jgi:hypothetical protein
MITRETLERLPRMIDPPSPSLGRVSGRVGGPQIDD